MMQSERVAQDFHDDDDDDRVLDKDSENGSTSSCVIILKNKFITFSLNLLGLDRQQQ